RCVTTPIEIVATGARTPVGLTAETSAAAVRAGINRFREYPFATPSGEPVVVATDGALAPSLEGRERLLPMIEHVLDHVGRKLAPGGTHRGQHHLGLALPEERPGFSDRDATWIVDSLRARCRAHGFEAQVDLLGRGHAGGIRAVELASQEITRNPDTLF